jgi:hypothetical protein
LKANWNDYIPRGFVDGAISFDGQNFAQCVQTLAICAEGFNDVQMAWQVWEKMSDIPQLNMIEDTLPLKNIWKPNFPALRWVFGPAVLATAHLIYGRQKK